MELSVTKPTFEQIETLRATYDEYLVYNTHDVVKRARTDPALSSTRATVMLRFLEAAQACGFDETVYGTVTYWARKILKEHG